ncbi:MAG: ATP-dependent DNA helicase RecG [Candidatus Binatia bacterium]
MHDGRLDEVVQVLERPLAYLAARDFQGVERTRLPLDAIAERIERARVGADPAVGAMLEELGVVIDGLRRATDDGPALLRRAHALLRVLRGSGPEPAASSEGGLSPDAVAGALATLAQSAQAIRGVGPKRAAELVRFGLATVEDVLFHLPFRYEDRRHVSAMGELAVGIDAGTAGEVTGVRELRAGRARRPMLEVILSDGPVSLQLVWFNQLAYFRTRFRPGQRVLAFGRVDAPLGGGPLRMAHPDVTFLGPEEDPAEQGGVVPVYEKPTPWPVSAMRRIVQAAVADHAPRVPAAIPPAIAARQRLVDPTRALRYVHQPPPTADILSLDRGVSLAHRALIFDELFFLQLGLALRRSAAGEEPGTAFSASTRLVAALRAALPFRPTGAQERAFVEIVADLALPHPMRRLLQGDVGSGKTLVALMAALVVIEAGAQAAIMAPTELLAEQHYETVRALAEPLGVKVGLLTGAVKGARRCALVAALAAGRLQLAVGTHALIQEGVAFRRLGLAVVDEQHRFGVLQRAALQRRAGDSGGLDVLVMSATPIPRTLALTLYGDLAVSTLDELPPGRTPIRTELCRENRRDRMYERIRAEVAAGRQAYIVYPLVEESEKSSLKAATTMVRELAAGPLAGLRLDLVHGRMKPDEKDAVMRRFKARGFDVLVSTTVIEVGIDVPNATVIVIEHSERFGLAQLHQLRGRVGRGEHPGSCFLAVPGWMADETYQRLAVLEQTTDGFAIAEADLVQRGPGDFLGTRQAGLPPLRVANLIRDTSLLTAARDEASRWLRDDPDLRRPESAVVRAVLRHRWQGRLELARVG